MHGAELQTLEPLTMMAMGMLEAFERQREDSRVEMSVKEARETLWIALAEGALTATGIDANGAVVQIPSHEWPYLKLEADGKFMDRLVFDNGLHERAYDNVTVRHGDVTSLWKGSHAGDDVVNIK